MMRTAIVCLLAGACTSGPPPRVPLGGSWPSPAPAWQPSEREYTRRAARSKDWNEVVNVIAVLMTPRWRAARVAEWQRRTQASPDAVAKLADAERQTMDTTWQVQLFVATSNASWNDLARKERSIWRLTLVGDDGREVLPTAVVADRRPIDEIRAWHPMIGAFHKAYLVTFPKKTADGHELLGTQKKLILRMGSGLADVEMIWEEP